MIALREPKRTVWLLFLAQALNQSAMTGQVAMAALIGHALAEDKTLATLPMAVQMLATMSVSIPGAVIFGRLGRYAGFIAGAAASLIAMGVFFAALWVGSFRLFLLGCVFSGAGFGISMYYRFAAVDCSSDGFKSKAISLVMAVASLSPPTANHRAWGGPGASTSMPRTAATQPGRPASAMVYVWTVEIVVTCAPP